MGRVGKWSLTFCKSKAVRDFEKLTCQNSSEPNMRLDTKTQCFLFISQIADLVEHISCKNQ
jgi:hypothetical protein